MTGGCADGARPACDRCSGCSHRPPALWLEVVLFTDAGAQNDGDLNVLANEISEVNVCESFPSLLIIPALTRLCVP